MTFLQWWNKNYDDSTSAGADYTFGEEVWSAAQKAMQPTQFDNCPRCGAPTVYRGEVGSRSLECSVCDWVAVSTGAMKI